MRTLEIDSQTNLLHILNELKTTEEDGLELTSIPNEDNVLDNPIHQAVIEKVAKNFNKEVIFPATEIEKAPEVESDNLGFVEGEDVFAKAPIEEVHDIIQPNVAAVKEVVPKNKKFKKPNFLKNKWFLIIGATIGVFSIFLSLLYFLPSSKIELVLSAENKNSQLTIEGDTTVKEVDIKNKITPMKVIEVTKEDNDEVVTSGKKTIGTYAKGRVTIYNLDTENEKSFPANSTIITPVSTSNITYKLDNDVVIPKAPILGDPSSIGVNVTALKSGSEGNLAAGVTFKINSISNIVYAQNDLAFSGGSSKQINVASTEDREALKKQIIDKITKEAKDELEKQTKNSIVPEDGLETEVIKETYEPSDFNTEADKLKATIKIQIKTFVLDRNDLIAISIDSLEKSSQGFSIDKEASAVTAQQFEKLNESNATFLVKIQAVLHPEINKKEINREITGKSLGEVKSYFDSIENIKSYKVTNSPSFFQFLNRMPFSTNQIKINIKNK